MPEDRVLGLIKKAINEREKTDRIMSFGGYIGILIFLYIIGFIGLAAGISILGFIPAIIFMAYIFYLLIKREEHFKNERKLLSNLILWFEGKIDESKISNLKSELKDREIEEEEKHPVAWPVLNLVTFGFAGLYIYYFLNQDFYRHDKREAFMLRSLHDAMESVGAVFLIPMKQEHQYIPKRNYILYLILTVLTLGIFGIYWFYILFKDPNVHFEYQKEWENKLLEAIQTPIPNPPRPAPIIPSTTPGTTPLLPGGDISKTTEPLIMKAELILPKSTIEIKSNENAFGRSDFENDISKEDLSYISKNHFMITKQGDVFYIQDDRSLNGTRLNDMEIKNRGKMELKDGDRITLAGNNNFIITFKINKV